MAVNPESVEACAERLRLTRVALGYSQAEICRLADINYSAWNNAETGDNKIGIESALRLCARFSLTLEWLYRGNYGLLPADLIERIEKEAALPAKRGRRGQK